MHVAVNKQNLTAKEKSSQISLIHSTTLNSLNHRIGQIILPFDPQIHESSVNYSCVIWKCKNFLPSETPNLSQGNKIQFQPNNNAHFARELVIRVTNAFQSTNNYNIITKTIDRTPVTNNIIKKTDNKGITISTVMVNYNK